MSPLSLRSLALLGLLAAVMAVAPALLAEAPNESVTREKIIHYFRGLYNLPDSVKTTMTGFHDSPYPDFFATTLDVDDGKQKQSQPLFVSRSMRYFIEGDIFKTQAANQTEARAIITRHIREHYNVAASAKITLGEPHPTIYADFSAVMITVDEGKVKRSRGFYVSRNMRYAVDGIINNLYSVPRQEIVRLISLEDQPGQGPANAPVTLVEYSDLGCPHCALMQKELETEIIPKYGDKLRVVFKEFPLMNLHDWAITAAMAAQCTYQIAPSLYAPFRSLVFQNQETLTGENARDMLLHYGAEAGADNIKLAACIDSSATLPRVEANMLEGNALGITQTPTSYVNGRMVVGDQPASDFYKLIDEAMHDHR